MPFAYNVRKMSASQKEPGGLRIDWTGGPRPEHEKARLATQQPLRVSGFVLTNPEIGKASGSVLADPEVSSDTLHTPVPA
jgi:hypothetical protein